MPGSVALRSPCAVLLALWVPFTLLPAEPPTAHLGTDGRERGGGWKKKEKKIPLICNSRCVISGEERSSSIAAQKPLTHLSCKTKEPTPAAASLRHPHMSPLRERQIERRVHTHTHAHTDICALSPTDCIDLHRLRAEPSLLGGCSGLQNYGTCYSKGK